MSLPKINQPIFNITIPSTKKKVTFRPFTVKEEKILLIAQESNDIKQIVTAIKQIVKNCVDDVNVDELATFDLEYILVKLRAQSVNNEVEFTITDPETEEKVELSVDLNELEVTFDEDHKSLIEIEDDLWIQMQYPRIDSIASMSEEEDDNKTEKMFELMLGSIKDIVHGEDVYPLKDHTPKEAKEFFESLTSQHLTKIKDFFETMPSLKAEIEYTREDGEKKTFVAEGTQTFFL
jgi:hypothetical protein